MGIVRFKDRFTEPTPGGWADLCLNVMFCDGPQVVWELQLAHKALTLVRSNLGAHDEYVEYRAATEIEGRLRDNNRALVSPNIEELLVLEGSRSFPVVNEEHEHETEISVNSTG